METTPSSFADLNLSAELLTLLDQAGFAHPTPIQEKAIPLALQGGDLMGCAQTGTGKTLAFSLPLLQTLRGKQGVKALILCPTREIALQTHEVLEKFGPPLGVSHTVLIGGRRIHAQIEALRKKPNILVATPGRLVDHLERNNVQLHEVSHVVLDEADHMLDLGFLPQVKSLLRALPTSRQTLMFSATFPGEIDRLAQQFLKNPQRVEITRPGTAASGIQHALYLIDPQFKRAAILELLKEVTHEPTLVFTRTKLDADWLRGILEKQGHKAHALHSDRSQAERTQTLEKFKQGEFPILVTTDLMARGIDISGITHVINFDIPQNPEDYVHRVGRTARGQATGDASTLATWLEMHYVQAIEEMLEQKIPRKTLPGIPEFVEMTSPKAPLGKIGRKGKRVLMR